MLGIVQTIRGAWPYFDALAEKLTSGTWTHDAGRRLVLDIRWAERPAIARHDGLFWPPTLRRHADAASDRGGSGERNQIGDLHHLAKNEASDRDCLCKGADVDPRFRQFHGCLLRSSRALV